jgi:hypothetical protein
MIEQQKPHKVPGMNTGVPEEWAVPAELVAHFIRQHEYNLI